MPRKTKTAPAPPVNVQAGAEYIDANSDPERVAELLGRVLYHLTKWLGDDDPPGEIAHLDVNSIMKRIKAALHERTALKQECAVISQVFNKLHAENEVLRARIAEFKR